MSDIEFLSIKEFEGKLRKNEGNVTVAGDLATLTANTGKDMYIARAKCVVFRDITGGESIADEVVLKINGIVVETLKVSMGSLVEINGTLPYEFKDIGHKVAAAQIIKLEVITLDSQSQVEGFIECFEEATGATPQVPAI